MFKQVRGPEFGSPVPTLVLEACSAIPTRICDLWVRLRDPASMNKVENLRGRGPQPMHLNMSYVPPLM